MFRQFAVQRAKHLEDNVWVHGMEPLFEQIFVARDALRQQSGERVAKQDVDDALIHRFVDFRRQKYFFSSNRQSKTPKNQFNLLVINILPAVKKRKPHNLLVSNILPFSLSLYIEREKERDIHIYTHTHHPRCKGVGIGIKEYDKKPIVKQQNSDYRIP